MPRAEPSVAPNKMRPRARLMLTIGLELISGETVALSELVKNSFDADAGFVLVRVTGPVVDGEIPAGAGTIEVLDDGTGMDGATLAHTWLEPATPSRRRKRTSDAGRRVLGEKGVGRFAAAKLAHELDLVSLSPGQDEVALRLNWDDFEDESKYLDQVPITWQEAEPSVFVPGGEPSLMWREALSHGGMSGRPRAGQGTLLRMRYTRTAWDEALFKDLRSTLSRLVSPFSQDDEVVQEFSIILDVPPAFGVISGPVDPPEELHQPHYVLDAAVDALGHATGTMLLKGEPLDLDQQLVNAEDETPDPEHPLLSGPFSVRLRVWDRDVQSLAEIAPNVKASSVRNILDEAAGINIYRDGFRVLPYGERGDDWLRLDLRRVQSPTRRLSNNQIAGYVLIGRDSNPDLVDQTNREGLVEGPALADLRAAVLQLLNAVEQERYRRRPRQARRPKGGLLDRIDLGELKAAIAARLPRDQEIVAMVTDLQQQLDERNHDVGDVLARYHRLATLGQLVDRVVHELGQPLVSTRQAARLGLDKISAFGRADGGCRELLDALVLDLTTIQEQANAASDVVRRIQPFGGRRRGRPPQLRVEHAIRDAVELLKEDVEKVGAAVTTPTGSTTTVTVDGTELQEVLVNLLANSLYWLRRVPRGRRAIDIDLNRNADGSLSVTVADSGPGIAEEDRDRIFDPYFTTRENGVGLGLSIAGEIVSDFYGGELELLPPGPLGGARFRATLRRRVS